MIMYPKIDTLFKRGCKGKLILGEWACPEFEYLANNKWLATEKIDGTNIRVYWSHIKKTFEIGGRTDNAQIPTFLFKKLTGIFTKDKFIKLFPSTDICLYGEGFGNKIQKVGSQYIKNDVDFILFDALVGKWWLKREDVRNIACSLDLKLVPEYSLLTLYEAINLIKKGIKSTCTELSIANNLLTEGLVLKPKVELKDRAGNRIITKIKHKDFNNINDEEFDFWVSSK